MTTATDSARPRAGSNLRRALTFSALGTAGARAIGAIGGVVVARALHPAARGDLAVLVVFASIGSLVGAAGVQFWIAREVARTDSMRGPHAVVALHSIAVVIAVTVAGLVVAPWVVPTAVTADAFAATVAYAGTGGVCFVALALPNGLRSMGVVSGAVMLASVTYLAGAIWLWATGTASVSGVLWFATLGNVGTLVVVLGFWWRCRGVTRSSDSIGSVRTWWKGVRFGAAGGAGELVLFAMFRIDFLLVAAFLPLADVGIYAVATGLTELLWIVPDGSAQVLLPTGARADEGHLFAPIFRVASVVSLIVAVGLTVVARPAISVIFGTAYGAASGVVPFLAVAAVAGGAWKMLAADIAARASTSPRLTSALVGLAVMVGSDLIAIPHFGLAGAGFSAAIGYAAALMFIARAWVRESGIPAGKLIGLHAHDLSLIRGTRHRADAAREVAA